LNVYLRLIEILALIVLPLLVFYLRSKWPQKEILILVTVLPLLWYLFYAPIHEISHIFGCIAIGAEIKDYRLFAHFWKGDFGFAYVDVAGGLGINFKSLIILISPYVLDFLSLLLGYFILSRYKTKNSLWAGLIFLFLCLRPTYDIIDNYIGIIYNHSDFVLIIKIIGWLIAYSFGLITAGFAAYAIGKILQRYKNYPLIKFTIKGIKPG
jgi:hypothetical protein